MADVASSSVGNLPCKGMTGMEFPRENRRWRRCSAHPGSAATVSVAPLKKQALKRRGQTATMEPEIGPMSSGPDECGDVYPHKELQLQIQVLSFHVVCKFESRGGEVRGEEERSL